MLFLLTLNGYKKKKSSGPHLLTEKEALFLGMLQDGVVTEEVLVWGLDAEGPLCSHVLDSLPHVQCAHVL